MKVIYLFLSALSALVVVSQAKPDGKELFTMNCSACHLLDKMVVGPSLAEMRVIYYGKPEVFVKWCVAPEVRRENVIEMPSMAHLGDEGLLAIYEHIMRVSDGIKMKVNKGGDLFASSPTQAVRPQVQRIFMPDSGPASVAVALDDEVSLCWDAGVCRLRYAWSGGFIDGYPYWKGSGNELAKIKGEIFYTEEQSPMAGRGGDVKFLGYSMNEGLAVFRYRMGDESISEAFRPLSSGVGFERVFTISPEPSEAVVLSFPEKEGVNYSSDVGSWEGGELTLEPSEAVKFTITILRK